MGAQCPTCNTYQPMKAVHTLDGNPPTKSSDVIFVTLGCGHAFGKKEFNEYQKVATEIKMRNAKAVREIIENEANEISLLFSKQLGKNKEVGKI